MPSARCIRPCTAQASDISSTGTAPAIPSPVTSRGGLLTWPYHPAIIVNKMADKKWYNFFVSVESEGASQGAPVPVTDDAARAVADIAASIGAAPKAAARAVTTPPNNPTGPAPSTAAPAPPAALTGRPLDLSEIYSAAEITTPAHGYTVLKVAEMLQSPHIKDMPAEVRRSSVLVALDAAGVKVQQIVEDAVRRDKALDAFERIQQKAAEDFEAAKLEENRKLQAELDKLTADYQAKMRSNTEAAAKRREAFAAWRVQKQIEEQKISDCVSYFVTENPITTSRPVPPATPATGA